MSEDNTRKASDILLSLEKKVDSLSQAIIAFDMNLKLILKRVNELSSGGVKNNLPIMEDKKEVPSLRPTAIADVPMAKGRIDRPVSQNTDTTKQKVQEKVIVAENKENVDVKKIFNERKIPVVQRVTDDKGKDLFMADVIIYDANGTQLEKNRTSAVGKWSAHLKPGKYSVHISKIDASSKSKIESLQEFVIEESMSALKLNTAIIRRTPM